MLIEERITSLEKSRTIQFEHMLRAERRLDALEKAAEPMIHHGGRIKHAHDRIEALVQETNNQWRRIHILEKGAKTAVHHVPEEEPEPCLFGFDKAMALLRSGGQVIRKAWDWENAEYVEIQNAGQHSEMGLPYVYRHVHGGQSVPWAPSQEDLLAVDWFDWKASDDGLIIPTIQPNEAARTDTCEPAPNPELSAYRKALEAVRFRNVPEQRLFWAEAMRAAVGALRVDSGGRRFSQEDADAILALIEE